MMTSLESTGYEARGVLIFRNLLLLAVYGFALSLLLGRGTYELSLYLCTAAVAGRLASGGRLQRPALAVLGIGLIFLLQGWLLANGPIMGKFHTALLGSLLMVTAINLLPDRVSREFSHGDAAALLLVLFVAAQIAGYALHVNRAGLFSNMHYSALYSAITLPILYYFVLQSRSAIRWVLILALVGDFWLLMQAQSRPGYLALLAAALAPLPFLSSRYRRLVLSTVVLIPAALYFTGLLGFAARINDLVANFGQEERPLIWLETLLLQLQSSPLEWWFGHGLGQFFRDYQGISSLPGKRDYYSPHNFFLEILHSHGITGIALFVFAYGLFYWKLAARIRHSRDDSRRRLGILLVSVTTAHLVLGFITLPFFSRHNLHPLSLILGTGLRYITIPRRND